MGGAAAEIVAHMGDATCEVVAQPGGACHLLPATGFRPPRASTTLAAVAYRVSAEPRRPRASSDACS
jgi:hypothetical protein